MPFFGKGNGENRTVPMGATQIKIPATVTKIDSDAFAFAGKDEWTGSDYITIYPFTIHAPAGSYAETYAKENNIPFVAE